MLELGLLFWIKETIEEFWAETWSEFCPTVSLKKSTDYVNPRIEAGRATPQEKQN